MAEVFRVLLQRSLSAGWLVIAVIAFRLVFPKMPGWLRTSLWGMIGIRLILPVLPDSGIHFPVNEIITAAAMRPVTEGSGKIWMLTGTVWVMGVVGIWIYEAVCAGALHRRLKTAVRFSENVFQSEWVKNPFAAGIFSPRIYVPFHLDEQTRNNVIAHERAHGKRMDHLWKFLAFAVWSVYWVHPLLWLAYVLFCEDLEFACDDSVMKKMTEAQRAEYAQSLLRCSVNKKSGNVFAVSFGGNNVKKRIQHILTYQKAGRFTVTVSAFALVLFAAISLTEPKHMERKPDTWRAEGNAEVQTSIELEGEILRYRILDFEQVKAK